MVIVAETLRVPCEENDCEDPNAYQSSTSAVVAVAEVVTPKCDTVTPDATSKTTFEVVLTAPLATVPQVIALRA